MGLFRRPAFSPASGGAVRVGLGRTEREVLGRLVGDLRSGLVAGAAPSEGSHPEHLRRLFPTAHPDDADAEAEYRRLVGDDLLRQRLEALDAVDASLDAQHLDAELADTWMTVLNDLRLVLGTVLDVSEDDDVEIDPDDPLVTERVTYAVLTQWLGELIEGRSPRHGPGDPQATGKK